MKEYLALCLEGERTIPEHMAELQKSLNFIAWKENFYQEVLDGKTEYHSDLIAVEPNS